MLIRLTQEQPDREPADGYFYQPEKRSGNRLNNAQDRLFLFSTMGKCFAHLASDFVSFRSFYLFPFVRFPCFLSLVSFSCFGFCQFFPLFGREEKQKESETRKGNLRRVKKREKKGSRAQHRIDRKRNYTTGRREGIKEGETVEEGHERHLEWEGGKIKGKETLKRQYTYHSNSGVLIRTNKCVSS